MVDLVVIATKAMNVRAAGERAHLLGPETVVLPIQNGLGSPRPSQRWWATSALSSA